MAAAPILDPNKSWPGLAPLGSDLWVLTVKLMKKYVDAWDQVVRDHGQEAVRTERDRMHTKKRCRSRAIRDALLDMERTFYLGDRGVVDPHDEDDLGVAPDASPRTLDELIAEHIETRPDYHISSDEAIVQQHQSDLPGMAEHLTIVSFESLVKTAAGVLLDTGGQRYVRVIFDLDAPNKEDAAELFDRARRERNLFRRGRQGAVSARSRIPSPTVGWDKVFRFVLAVREARRMGSREGMWRIYKRLVDDQPADSSAKKYARNRQDLAKRRIGLEEERVDALRAEIQRVEDEILAGPRMPIRIYPRWIEAYLPPRTQRIYRARVSRLLSKLKDAAVPTKTSVK